ncbi:MULTISPECIES: GAP family protein [unclassified Isoptericola]|uniref:GAP family protein n=1 Tax=unclassified Isoptericola TaxID=2623355 RepID=UPI0027133186|nr:MULTISPECIES: GAP family protein [unclassified Isoptericola]MDO8143338.1 GAP family protein [Isoptericola sp. 178]MDO8147201.1 GAP family protein [Isoptericola sp. b515]MDO8150487.1 GAP family protein [Isoptericola sp. b408]
MGEAVGVTIGYAVGIAISPLPVAAVILMLFSRRARVNSLVFMLAWIVGVAGVVTLVLLIPGLGTDSGEPGTTAGWVKLVLGALLLLTAGRQWAGRPGPDDEPPVPGWMSRIDELRPVAAAGLGVALSAVNPKNLLLAAAAGASLGALSLSTGGTVASVAVFTALATLTVTLPVLGYLVAGRRLAPALDRTKTWLIANNATVMAVLLVVFGVSLLGDALQILT